MTGPETTDPTSCQQCGETHVRCSAHRKDGRPCGQPPRKGQRVCRKHGGNAPAAIAKAEERLAAEHAEEELRTKLWRGLGVARAVEDPFAEMATLGGALRDMVDEAGRRVTAMKHLAGGEHLTQLRGEVLLLERVLRLYQTTLDSLGKFDIAGRHIQLEQGRAQLVISAFLVAMEPAMALVEEGRPADEVRALLESSFLAALRRVSAAPVVAGEVAS